MKTPLLLSTSEEDLDPVPYGQVSDGVGELQNGKIAGPKLFANLPVRQGKTLTALPFKGWKHFAFRPTNKS